RRACCLATAPRWTCCVPATAAAPRPTRPPGPRRPNDPSDERAGRVCPLLGSHHRPRCLGPAVILPAEAAPVRAALLPGSAATAARFAPLLVAARLTTGRCREDGPVQPGQVAGAAAVSAAPLLGGGRPVAGCDTHGGLLPGGPAHQFRH